MDDLQFHRASLVEAVLDLIEDGDGGSVSVEWSPRIADYARLDRAGAPRCVVRARSGAQSQVVSSDLWMAVRRWSCHDAPRATFVYHSEAALYSTAVSIVGERLERFAAGVATEEDRRVVRVIGLSPDDRCLRHVHLRMRSGPLDQMVAAIRWRVQRLIEPGPGHPPAGTDGPGEPPALGLGGPAGPGAPARAQAVTRAIARLLEQCRADRGKVRTILPEEACEAVGVCPARLADGPGWEAADVEGYRLSALRGGHAGPTGLDRGPAPCVVPAGHAAAAIPEPIAGLAGLPSGAAVLGPASARMEAAVEAVCRAEAASGGTPLLMGVRGYRYRGMVTSVRCRLEAITGMRVGAVSARRFLAQPGLVLLLDGGLASIDAELALVQDLRAVRASNPSLRVFTFGMGSGHARLLGLPLFRLQASARADADDVGSVVSD